MLANRIKTIVKDPSYHNNYRTEFRIDQGKVMLSNLRLIDIGCTAAAATTTDPQLGILGIIKNVFLYDGGVLLDQIYNFRNWIEFVNLNRSNNENASVNTYLNGSNAGYTSRKGVVINAVPAGDYFLLQSYAGQKAITTDVNTTFKGWFQLTNVLDFLSQSTYLSTNVFQNLRLVIEWDGSIVAGFNGLVRPSLVYDELIDPKVASQVEKSMSKANIIYKPIERDVLYVAAIAANNTPQSIKFQPKAFDGKTLIKVLIARDTGNGHSRAFNAEKLNLIVNGRQLVPYDGIDLPNKKLMYLNDAWSTVNLLPGSNDINYDAAAEIPMQVQVQARPDWFGLNVGEKISELAVSYSRASTTAANTKTPFFLTVYGEVIKAVMIDNGAYNVMYL